MDSLYKVRDMLEREIEEISHGNKLTQGILDTIQKLTASIKAIDTIEAMQEGYSNEGSYRGSYDDRSYAIDRRGRNYDGSYRTRMDGGRDQRYSRDLKDGLRHLMRNAKHDEKIMIEDWMRQLDD